MLEVEGERLIAKGQLEDGLAIIERILNLAVQLDDETFVALARWRTGLLHLMAPEADKLFDWIRPGLLPSSRCELLDC
jgi:hypothetical protein